jgi:tetratricopeptide (TPR) repeat protein
MYYICKGDVKKAIEHCKNSIRLSEESNYSYLIAINWAVLGYGYWFLGDLNTASDFIEKGFNKFKNTPAGYSLPIYPLYLSYVHHDLGNFSNANSYAEEALNISIKNNDHHHEGLSMIWLGRILGRKNRSKRTEVGKYILQGIEILKELKLRPFLSQGYFFLGELYANSGRKDEALENLNKALSMCQEMGIGYWPDKIQKVLDRL